MKGGGNLLLLKSIMKGISLSISILFCWNGENPLYKGKPHAESFLSYVHMYGTVVRLATYTN